jgi:hypothetical protein
MCRWKGKGYGTGKILKGLHRIMSSRCELLFEESDPIEDKERQAYTEAKQLGLFDGALQIAKGG